MKKLKVLMLLSTYGVASGVNTFAMNYLREMNHDEIQVDFAVYNERESPYIEEINRYGGQTFVLPPVKNLASHIEACRDIIKNGHYDVIHDNSLILAVPIMFVAKEENVPVRILHSHATELGENKWKRVRNKAILPLLKMCATDYMACSNAAGKAMFGRAKYTVVPNVVPCNKLNFNYETRNKVRKEMNVENKLVVATVGRAAYQKNPFFILDIIKKLTETTPEVIFWWIGNGPLEEQICEHAAKLGLEKNFVFLGKRTDVVDLYQAVDCIVMPSIFEGLPVTGIEAQAMGLPMVVSNTVTDEMVYTDLVDYVDLNAPMAVWVEHLKEALRRNADRAKYADVLRRSAFSNVDCGKNLMDMYKKMLG